MLSSKLSMSQTGTKVKTADLVKEVKLLRSFVIGFAGKDDEGDYNPQFAERVLKALVEKPTEEFTDSKSFLVNLRKL